MTIRTRFGVLTLVLSVFLLSAGLRAGDESVAAARELYASAAYEDALGMLNRLRTGTQDVNEQMMIEQYRAFCLLALGRPGDAQQAIELVVTAQPFFVPSDSEVSPRVRAAFSDVRKRLLPGIIQDRYARAKSAYDGKDFSTAATEFEQVLKGLADPDLGNSAGRAPLSDIRTLATGFHELSVAAATPPPPPEPVKVAEAKPAAAPAPEPAVVRTQPYGVGEPGVVAPVPLQQRMPEFDRRLFASATPGLLEIVIDETGKVESAALRTPVHPKYDSMLLDATKSWRFKPATVQGQPVKFRKTMTIAIKL